ncbi:MAG TPA: substrate-binding domain-containing protein, partial [Anaerolineales bacterium]
MLRKNQKYVLLVTVLFTIASLVAACGTAATPAPATQPPATQPPAATEPAATEPAATQPAAAGPFTIGISNPFISSEYRTQMIDELIQVNKEYMDKGLTTELVIESADTDVAGQIQQLQNLMAKNVDAILVNPGDVNGLNATLEEAVKKGIIVISVDQELNVPGVYNVGIDQKEWAKTSAQWLADKLGGKGNVVEIEGFPGHPANVARMEGVDEVFAKYPDIKVL